MTKVLSYFAPTIVYKGAVSIKPFRVSIQFSYKSSYLTTDIWTLCTENISLKGDRVRKI